MIKRQLVSTLALSSLMMSVGAMAATENIKITGTIPTKVLINQLVQGENSALVNNSAPAFKQISLMHIELSDAAKKYLATSADKNNSELLSVADSSLPPAVSDGMNDVPVLDQGQHGTCVTFATSGALDAAYGKTDYISQLCNLSLGSYLEKKDSSYPSGWEGSWGDLVIDQIKKYGIISMTYQKQYGCGSATKKLKAYPADASSTGYPMSVASFAKHSEQMMKDIYSKELLNHNNAYSSRANMDAVLTNVKTALSLGHRVTFGTLLDVNGSLQMINGAAGTYHNASNDAWVVTPQVKKDAKAQNIDAGHEMIITGYDDNAVIAGPKNTKHKGVLTLRNSWGTEAGDQGEYYMSYEYFKLLANEAHEISPTPVN
jgi:C1A family cysteine protease